MSSFTLSQTCSAPFDQTVAAVRAALSEAGFGVLTEIDMKATLSEKIGVDTPEQLILGACNPHFAYEAIQADPAIAALLPCNVVVRSVGESTTMVEAFDPAVMQRLSPGEAGLGETVGQVRASLEKVLARVAGTRSPN